MFDRFISERQVRWLLGLALALPVLLCVWLTIAWPQSSDQWFYKHWSRLVTLHGVSAAYAGEPSKGYVDYPPFLLYAWKILGHAYQLFGDAEFDEWAMLENEYFTFGHSLIALLFYLGIGWVLYRLSRARYGERAAVAAAVLFLLNPAALYNVAYLGLPDTVHAFWLVLAFGLAEAGRARAGWVAAALAALTKPQAWGLMPLFGWRQLCVTGWRKTLVGILIAALTAVVVVMPFIVNGTFGQLLQLPAHMADVQPFASAQAHNLWWLVTAGNGMFVPDATPLLGPVTMQQTSLLLLAASGLLVVWRARTATVEMMLMLPAFQAFAWFCLTTRAHDNHWFFVLPLLALALPTDRRLLWIFAAVSVTGFCNLLLHDPYFTPGLVALLSRETIAVAQLANCVANLTILGFWTTLLFRAPAKTAVGSSESLAAAGE